MTRSTDQLICPVCEQSLRDSGTGLQCGRGHSFDRAREGYVHLLPAGHGLTGKQGDTLAMVQARQRFLARGYFRPLARALVQQVTTHLSQLPRDETLAIAEIGCGAGDYIGSLARAEDLAGAQACYFGIDISREALRLAARAHPAVCFLVNDATHRLCFAPASVHLLLDIFAPRNQLEFSRVLHPEGALLVVVPGGQHLAELRARVPLLAVEPDKLARTVAALSPAFREAARQSIEYEITVAPEDLPDLLRMTPSAWHLDEQAFARVAEAGALGMTAAFRLLHFVPAN